MNKEVGKINKKVINLLELAEVKENTPIYIGKTNIVHIKQKHFQDFEKYFDKIELIISKPDMYAKILKMIV